MSIVLGKEAPDDLDLLLQLGGQLLQSGDILDLQPKVFSLRLFFSTVPLDKVFDFAVLRFLRSSILTTPGQAGKLCRGGEHILRGEFES